MKVKDLVHKYLQNARIMQLATSASDQPWVCNIHFYSDDDLNMYWISTPQRRHSQEIAKNPKVSAAILIHEDTESEKYVIGLSVEGTASLLSQEDVEQIGPQYIKKLSKDPQLLKDIQEGKNPHVFYKLTPSKIVLFDTKNFSNNPRQEFILS